MKIKKDYLKEKLIEFYSQLKCDCESSIGWDYSEVYEKKFIEKIDLKIKKKEKKDIKKITRNSILNQTILEQIQNILNEQDMKVSWKKLTNFLDYHNKMSLFDTINETNTKFLNTNKGNSNEINKLNILTYGSGICGLFFAHTLKQILGDLVEIIIYDKRIKSKGQMKPFSREWLTALNLSYFKSTKIEVYNLIKKFALGDYIGLPINYIEIILFLFCKLQKINFIFDKEENAKILLNKKYDLIVDATGGRFKYENNKKNASKIISKEIPEFINSYGERKNLYKKKEYLLKQEGRYFYPLHKNNPIQIAQLKITNLDNSDYISLRKYIGYENKFKGMLYLWKGLLPNEINQSLLIININNNVYKNLFELINEKTLLKDFILNDYQKIFGNEINEAINILQNSKNFKNIFIEPPFIYHPKLINYKQIVTTSDSTPIIPIGDSVFNGNVKSSNGLYKHLPMINNLNKVISKSLLNILTEYLEKKSKEKTNKNFICLHNQVHDILNKIWS